MECEYCKKVFSTKSNLSNHQKSTKYCLSIQGATGNNYSCDYCSKTFTQLQSAEIHKHTCKEKKKIIEKNDHEQVIKNIEEKFKERLKEKDEYIAKLEARLDKFENVIATMAAEPKTTNNTMNTDNSITINNRFDIDNTEHISGVLKQYLTKDVIARGQEGVALMLVERLLKGPNGESLYDCTDVSRQKFEYTNMDGYKETDPKALKLIRNIEKSGLCEQAKKASDELWNNENGVVDPEKFEVFNDSVLEVMTIDKDSKKLRAKLASVTARRKTPKRVENENKI
jgi:arsenate reductase-like glutaredoxin family protein